MKKILKYTFLAVCILAPLTACNDRLDPVPGDGLTDEAISFNAGVVATKGLIEADADFSVENTTLQVYDYLTVSSGEVQLIDNRITGVASGSWKYVDNRQYFWTKTGTHRFFGYLTQDPDKNVFAGATQWAADNNKKLIVAKSFENGAPVALGLTPDTATQFDFLYSDVVERNSATDSHGPVELSMFHLFTALAVEVVNQTEEGIPDLSVSLIDVAPEQYAEIDWSSTKTAGEGESAKTVPTVTYQSAQMSQNNGEMLLNSTPKEVPVSTLVDREWTSTPLFTDAEGESEYRLLWPQTFQKGSEVCISFSDGQIRRTATLSDLKDASGKSITQFEPGKKYQLTINILSPTHLYISLAVSDWIDADVLDYTMNLNTNMRLFDSWLYRYDTDQNYEQYWKWQTSHMVVSDGLVSANTPGDVENRPLRSPQIQLVTTGTGAFHLVSDNENFQFVKAVKENGVITSCVIVTQLDIPANKTDEYTYFYIIPKPGVVWNADAKRDAHIQLLYDDPVLGTYKVTFNYSSLPGYSDDSSEIWVYYFPADEYNNTNGDKLKMYYQDSANPLVPTSDQS